ncbi:MAG: NtrZ family periplasmic regulatory protein [Brevundimonas sp.]|uniref:NtrZ family periplasmic regulatory protein n=1 Tax=Brevundimonas sp. TaxID=1871086 RepID=UPI00391D4062
MRRLIMVAGTAAALALVAGVVDARAQGSQQGPTASRAMTAPSISLTTPPSGQPATARRGVQFYEGGRWGLNLNQNQPVGRDADWSDVEAGAFYRVNPRLRVGGAVGLGEPEADPARAAESDRRSQPRVRLESIFRF